MGSYSIQKHHGNWQVRWSVYKVVDGRRRRTQPTHIVGPDSLKKSDAESLAGAYFARVQRSRTVQAGSSLSQFVTNVFLPDCETRLSIRTTKLYRQQWKRLEPHLGSMRLRDVTAWTSDIAEAEIRVWIGMARRILTHSARKCLPYLVTIVTRKISTMYQRLAFGDLPNGGVQSFSLPSVIVSPGQVLYFIVDPKNGDYGCDTTMLDLTIDEVI